MKILLTGLLQIGYADTVRYALEQLGNTVYFVDSATFYHKSGYWKRKADKLLNYRLSKKSKAHWNDNLLEVCKKEGINTLLSLSTDQITKDTVDVLKKMGIYTVVWLIDGSARGAEFVKTAAWYDKAYTFDEADAHMLRNKLNLSNTDYLPVGYDDRYFYCTGNEKRTTDLCFVGSADSNRKELLEKIAIEAEKNNWVMHIQGVFYSVDHFWKKLLFRKKYPHLFKFLHNDWIDFKQVSELYRSSRICLNISTPGQKSINPRAFEIMASGAVHIMNSGQEVSQFIARDKEYIEYGTADELLKEIRDILSNQRDCASMVKSACQKTTDNYTMINLLKNKF